MPARGAPQARFLHAAFAVADTAAAAPFLEALLGYRLCLDEPGMTGQIRAITGALADSCDLVQLAPPEDVGGPVLELIAFRPPQGPGAGPAAFLPAHGAGGAHPAFAVPDLAAAIARAEALGARVLGAVTDFADCRAVYIAAPGGLTLELEQPHEPQHA